MERHLHIDNHTLVEECRNGDKEALNLFYLRFAPRMLSVIRRYVSDVKDAEDILHDGFIVAFTRLGSLRDADKVDYWLATIMKNLSLQFLQSQDVAQMLHDIPEVEDTPQIDEIIDLATLETLIKKLPAGYQKVFRLAVLENKSHKEIAKLLGIAPNSSSSQLFHAKLMMRKLITDYKKQTGVWCFLLLCGGAGIMLWHNLMPSKSSSSLLSYESTLPSSTANPALSSSSSTNSTSLSPATEAAIPTPASIDTMPMPPSSAKPAVSVVQVAGSSRKAALAQSISSANVGLLSNIVPENSDDTALPVGDNGEAHNQPNNEFLNGLNNEIVNDSIDNRELIAALSEKMDETEEKFPEKPDSVKVNDIPMMSDDDLYYAYLDDGDILSHRVINKSSFNDWSVKVSADAGLLAFNIDASFGDEV
ncbi:MAG: sigma-70 family RNA polymerase sigma factor, partial [Muribaculaceae bacterium]|nr:sigma-70 family RNA polymerase sigma factor [Muribaculaceae bacterium]